MQIGLYGRNRSEFLAHLNKAFSALGHKCAARTVMFYGKDQRERFDLVVAEGQSPQVQLLAQHGRETDTPVWVTDQGYLRRDRGYRRMALYHFNWLPDFDVPDDRFRALDIEVTPVEYRPEGEYILALGVGTRNPEASTGGKTVRDWAQHLSAVFKKPVLFRAHPQEFNVPTELKDDLAKAAIAVTWDSNAGNEALLAGVPLVCASSAQFAHLATTDPYSVHGPDDLRVPTEAEILTYFSRVAYAQWTPTEMMNGEAAQFMLAVRDNNVSFAPANDVPTDEQTVSLDGEDAPEDDDSAGEETAADFSIQGDGEALADGEYPGTEEGANGGAAPELAMGFVPPQSGDSPLTPEGAYGLVAAENEPEAPEIDVFGNDEPAPEPTPASSPAPKRRGRPRKASK